MTKIVDARSAAVLAIFSLVILAGAILGVVTALQAGPAWDDPLEIAVMNRELGVEAKPGLTYEAAKASYGDANSGHPFYGVVMQYAAHAIVSIADGRPFLSPEEPTLRNVSVRHFLALFVAFLGAGVLAVTAGIVGRSRELGFAVGAILMSTPIFLGHGAINVKDVPTGVGITLFSCGAALLLVQGERALRLTASAVALIVAGVFLAVGTRTGTIALIAIELAIVGALLLVTMRVREAILVGFGVVAGVLLAALLNPFGRKAPIQWLLEGALFSHEGFNTPTVRWTYVPIWILYEYPIPFLLLAAIGAVAVLYHLRGGPLARALPWTPFLVQGAVLPVLIVLSHAHLYDRLRHVFFIVPPFCLLAGFGLYVCVAGLKSSGTLAEKALGVFGMACLAVIFTASFVWSPYQYAYLNSFGRHGYHVAQGHYGFDTDRHGISVGEAAAKMRTLGVTSFRAGPSPVYESYVHEPPPAIGWLDLYTPGRPSLDDARGFYYVHSPPSFRAAGFPERCRTLFTIEREGIALGAGGEC